MPSLLAYFSCQLRGVELHPIVQHPIHLSGTAASSNIETGVRPAHLVLYPIKAPPYL